MAIFDLPLSDLQTYLPQREEPADFDSFWQQTLAQARAVPLTPRITAADYGLSTIESYDVTFPGFAGQPIRGWLLLPAHHTGPLPCVVEYIGYGGGRGFPIDWLLFPSAGYATFVMDTRGQGSVWQQGDTPDPDPDPANPQTPGFMTRGIRTPESYYYRRLYTDAVRAVEMVRTLPQVDPHRIAITGGSQGGGITLAVSGLVPDLIQAVMPNVPFMCHIRRAIELIDTDPYHEIVRYCKIHRDQVADVFRTLTYFDGMHFAARARARALFSVGLMDDICPPSTVFAAYNHYAGPKDIRVYPFNQHEGGQSFHDLEQLQYLKALWK